MNKKIAYSAFAAFSIILTVSGCASKEPVRLTPQELINGGKIEEAKSRFQFQDDINEIDENGNTVLHLAAKINDASLVQYLIINKADSEIKNLEGDTPLIVAIKNDAFDAAKELASFGGNLFARNSEGITALDLGLQKDPSYYDIFITTRAGEIRDTEGKSIVHYFVQTKNLRGVEQCIKKGIPVDIVDSTGNTPLTLAYQTMDDNISVEIAAQLIEAGAESKNEDYAYFEEAVASRNSNLRYTDGQTPLHFSAIFGHYAIADYLLAHEADTSSQDSAGATPLHEAIRYGHLDVASLLLDYGAYVNSKDNLGKTPIMLIMPKERVFEAYKLLLSYNANLKQKDMYGDTTLHNAAMLKADKNTLTLLLNNGADVNARNKEGVTPLEIAVQDQNYEATKLFTEYGANIHTQDTHGNSPFMLALNSTDKIFEAVVNKTNINSQDSDGNTTLHIALQKDAPLSKVQYIISLTEDVNTRNADGNSALFIAILRNRQKVGELLLAKNADIFSTNINNNSPLRLALKYGGTVQDWLVTSKTIKSTDGSGNTALHYAAEWQYTEAISSLLTKGADVNAKNANGETPLFNAVKTNNIEVLQLILDGGADINIRDNLGSTPLHCAVRWDADKSIKKLLDLGINVNAQNSSGKAALSEAVLAGKNEIAKTLLQKGANANLADTDGTTVLMDAIRSNNKYMVKTLLDYGANPQMQEINGRTAYHEAAYMGNIDIIRIIRNAGGNPLSRDKKGNTPFSIVLGEDIKTIREILGDSKTVTDSDGNTPIHIIVKANGKLSLLLTLISEGYPIDTRNADGYTPLNYAIEDNKLEIAKCLLEAGANPFIAIDKRGKNGISIALEKNNMNMLANIVKYAESMSDIQGNSILHYAAKSADEGTINMLLSYGIDKNRKNISGDTPYQIALRWKRPEIAELLK